MHHHQFKRLALAGCLAMTLASSVTFAQDHNLLAIPASKALDMDAEQYSKDYGVIYSEALRRLIIQQSSEAAILQLRQKHQNRFAGAYIEHTPTYRLVVRLTGNTQVPAQTLVLKNLSKTPFQGRLTLPVSFQIGAQHTLAQLKKIQRDNAQNFRKDYPNIQLASINEKTGNIDIEVYDPNAYKQGARTLSYKAAQASRTTNNLPVQVNVTNVKLDPAAAVRASETMIMTPSATGTNYFNCTTGFNIKNAAGTKYSSTAAHCHNYQIKVDDRKTTGNDNIALNFLSEFWNGSQDFQVMSLASTTHTLNPEFFASDNVVKTLTGRRTRPSTTVGDYVCHYGMKTKYSCGSVTSINAQPYAGASNPNKCGPNQNQVCNATWVKVSGPSLDCWGGDSGGPIFIGSVAAGLLSVATYSWTDANGNPVAWSDSMKGQGWCGGNAKPNGYMIYMSTDELYNQGYSLLYGQ